MTSSKPSNTVRRCSSVAGFSKFIGVKSRKALMLRRYVRQGQAAL
jgi:hypothetical protein